MRYMPLLLLFLIFYISSRPILSVLALVAAVAYCAYEIKEYLASSYYQVTKRSVFSVFFTKGFRGEYQVYKMLKHHENNGAKFLFNAYIPKENNETTEIDVLMISHNGIFVFESKNYSGWIYGNEKHQYWTQVLAGGHEKNRFYNPIWQNKGHIKHLSSCIGMDVPMFSIIVFSNRCRLKQIDIFSSQYHVVQRNEIRVTVDHIIESTPCTLTDANISAIYNKLFAYSQVSDDVKRKHIASIKAEQHPHIASSVEETDYEFETSAEWDNILSNASAEVVHQDASVKDIEAEVNANESAQPNLEENTHLDIAMEGTGSPVCTPDSLRCPWCGSRLVLRTAKRGNRAGRQFYGCSNYPHCHYIKNLE